MLARYAILLLLESMAFVLAYLPSYAQERLLINEIMANPSGSSLSTGEWIELYNPSDQTILLGEYALWYNQRRFTLPDRFLAARQYLILCDENAAPQLSRYGNVVSLPTWPVLNNTGATLAIEHVEHGIVDRVPYSNLWFFSTAKRNGGWSLERINPTLRCEVSANWSESEAILGGTPGRSNSVSDNGFMPTLGVVNSVVRTDVIKLLFNQQVAGILSVEELRLSQRGQGALEIASWDLIADTLLLAPSVPLQEHIAYEIQLSAQYCEQRMTLDHLLFLRGAISYNDIVINEVLFNPKPDGVDFVELYNRSGHTINLQGWHIGNRILSNQLFLLDVAQYLVVTTDRDITRVHYPSAILDPAIVLPSLPAYANQQGIVTITDENGMLIDSLHYHASMHQPFLSNPRGVSLERRSFDVDTNEPENFTSAATTSEGATPGYANSKELMQNIEKNKFFLLQKVISPDGDGSDDVLRIGYEIYDEHVMVNLHVFDDKGRLINRLIRNQSIGYRGEFIWDGKSESGAECPAGNYIIWAEIYDDRGLYEVFKYAFVLVRQRRSY